MKTAILGLLVTASGSISTAVGWALQKQAYNIVKDTNSSVLKTIHWWIGFLLVALTQPLYIIGISMVNQSTIGVVGPISIIANLLLAKFYLKEDIKFWEIVGVLLFIPGCILTLLNASMTNHRFSQEEFNKLFFSTPSLGYLILNTLVITIGLFGSYTILKTPDTQGLLDHDEGEESEDGLLDKTNISMMGEMGSTNFRKSVKLPDESIIEPERFEVLEGQDLSSKWRLLPMLLFPYAACFSTSLTMTLSRSLSGFVVAKGSIFFSEAMPYVYIGCIAV